MHLVVQYHHSENTITGYDNDKKKAYRSISNMPCAIRTVDGWHCSCYKKSTISRSRLMAPHSRVGYSVILPRTYQDCYADAIFDMTVDSKRVCACPCLCAGGGIQKPKADTKHLLILGVSLLCWGCWPTLRQLCGAPIAAFATLNICSQCATSFVYLFALGTAASRDQLHLALTHPSLRYAQRLATVESKRVVIPKLNITLCCRELCVFLGGFLLGHADQLSATAMRCVFCL